MSSRDSENTSNTLVAFPRGFQIWLYQVGHGQLLLRSTKADKFPTRVDILFKNVGAICLPMTFDGLTIVEAAENVAHDMWSRMHSVTLGSRKTFLISGSGFSGYVIAGSLAWHEDELEYYDKSYFSFSLEQPARPFFSRIYLVTKIRLLIWIHRVQAMFGCGPAAKR